MPFDLMSATDARFGDFAGSQFPEHWVVLHDGAVHAYDDNLIHRWDSKVYARLADLAKKHDLCFVFVGSQQDFAHAEKMCLAAGMEEFPFLHSETDPEEAKALMRHARGVISNQCTLLMASQDWNDLGVCLAMTSVDAVGYDPHIKRLERDEHGLLDAWVSAHVDKLRGQ